MQPPLSRHAINRNLWSALLIKRLLFSRERNFIRMLRPFARLPKPTSVLFAAFSSGNGKKETLAGLATRRVTSCRAKIECGHERWKIAKLDREWNYGNTRVTRGVRKIEVEEYKDIYSCVAKEELKDTKLTDNADNCRKLDGAFRFSAKAEAGCFADCSRSSEYALAVP